MGTWVTVLVALIVALSTLGATFFQNLFSNKRFKIELGRAIDVDSRKRKWEVRSEPLLKLRTELAIMATKQEKLAAASSTYLDLFGTDDMEEIKKKGKELQDAKDNWDIYWASENLKRILFLQNDNEVVNRVEEVLKDYNKAYSFFENYWPKYSLIGNEDNDSFNKIEEKLEKYRDVFKTNKSKTIEVQELINKKLEEL